MPDFEHAKHVPNHMEDDPNNGAIDNAAADHEGPVWAESEIANIRKAIVQEAARNDEVLYSFVSGEFNDKICSANLRMKHVKTGWALENYYVVVGFISDEHPDLIFINTRKYSNTTTKIQNKLRQTAIDGNKSYFDVDDTELNEIMVLGHTI